MFEEELVEDIEIIDDYFVTVAKDYVLSKIILLIAHLDVCTTHVCQSGLYSVGELGGTCYVFPIGLWSWWGKSLLKEGMESVWDGGLATNVS